MKKVSYRDGGYVQLEEVLKRIEGTMSSIELRELAESILRLADSIDQDWDPNQVRSNFPIFSYAAKIEKNAIALSLEATKEEARSKLREEAIGIDLVSVPAWNILLELFKQFSGGAKVSTKSIQITARCPETTALRIIDRLEEKGLVGRSQCDSDRRVTFVSLTRAGVTKVGSVLERIA